MPCRYDIPSSYMLEHMKRSVRPYRDSTSMQILSKLYPDNMIAMREIEAYRWKYCAVTRLVRANCIEKTDNCHVGSRYQLTLYGRCRVLCHDLGIGLLGLCILAEAYAVHRCQVRNRCDMSYSIQNTYDSFDGLYAKKTVRNAANSLVSGGFARCLSDGIIRINGDTMARLEKCEDVLDELRKWIAGVPYQSNVLSIESRAGQVGENAAC